MRQPDFLRHSLESDRGLRYAKDLSLNGERSRAMRQYYRLIEGLDFCVGQLLVELQQRGLAGNTVILFTSDNGHFAGEHGFFGKWFMHEESFRVPMIVCDPRLSAAERGRTCEAMALNIDLAPTILALGGVPAPPAMQGRSLLPLLGDPKLLLHDSFFYEHHFRYSPDIQPSEGVRTKDAKYIVWLEQKGAAREELYDLRDDPLEMKNRASDPRYKDLLQRLRREYRDYTERLK
jgi:arylsulfatase A-like enzyme